jgi:hypothetical protein
LVAILFFLGSLPVLAQNGGGENRASDPQFRQHRNQEDPSILKMERDRAKRLNKQRHETIKHDTDKLLALATELKQYVDKSNENLLSLDVMRKAEEIEKLARQVREKMKD